MDTRDHPPIDWEEILRGAGKKAGVEDPRTNPEFIGLGNRLAEMGKKSLIVLAIVLVLVGLFCYWWFHPAINIHNADCWFFVGLFILLPLFLVCTTLWKRNENGTKKHDPNPGKAKVFKMLAAVPVIIALIGVLGAVASLSLFPGNAERYATILETTEGDFSQDIEEVDYNTIPFIDRDSAVLLGNRTMGTMADFVSQFEISPLYSQINYQGKPVRVSPLNYADIFKWWANQEEGIPAYVIVDMNTQDTDIVRLENKIHYSDSDPLFKNVDRHVQLSYPTYMFDEKSFEIDEDGVPYWIYPVQDYTIGLFGGTTIQRVVLCNASTGECVDYAIDEVPQWVDRAYPTDLLIRQYNWSGALSDGWINSWLGQNGVKQTTPGTNGTLGYNYIAQDDDVWVYSGVTSATSDNSIIGFVLINQRTAESHFYAVAGATEESAMQSAEGQVQNLRYVSTFPLLINVSGQPTYFMALKDGAGLVKMYAMIDVQRYQNVATGSTLSEVQKSYENLLRTNGVSTNSGGESTQGGKDAGSTTGTITSIHPVVIDGNTHYYFLIDTDNVIYDCLITSLPDAIRYNVGDTITFNHGGGTAMVSVNSLG